MYNNGYALFFALWFVFNQEMQYITNIWKFQLSVAREKS